MTALLNHVPVFQDNDDVRVEDCAQTMRHKDACPGLFLEDAVDIEQESLLGLCIESRSLSSSQLCVIERGKKASYRLVEEEQLGVLQ